MRIILLIAGLAIMLCGGAQQAQAACATPVGAAADLVYNGTQKVFQYFDGTNWTRMNTPGSGSGGCTTPTAAEGVMSYNADNRVVLGMCGTPWALSGARAQTAGKSSEQA